ncbi:hypothetical protein BCR34DRAFT_562947 [Clohesyomyces aquaticus]|uniref:Secreted protein n=1 Tax=Clohesyomyces aquaticus TaxID=1231657 RepID=A0A1Y1ZRU0_9PLEO|nr:hypothetical protein BCR34DRAFT_562947 [Clohesyomyces aquaticus]
MVGSPVCAILLRIIWCWRPWIGPCISEFRYASVSIDSHMALHEVPRLMAPSLARIYVAHALVSAAQALVFAVPASSDHVPQYEV